jgi:hypothetical protein
MIAAASLPGLDARLQLARQQPQGGRWLWIVCRRFSGSRYLDPAVHALLALLHDREVERLAGFEVASKEALKHELVIPGVWQLPA